MKKLRKLPIFLAILVSVVASACTEIEVDPKGGGEDEETPIIIKPKPPTGP